MIFYQQNRIDKLFLLQWVMSNFQPKNNKKQMVIGHLSYMKAVIGQEIINLDNYGVILSLVTVLMMMVIFMSVVQLHK